MQPLTSRTDVDAALAVALAVVYKHSSRCSVSFGAYAEVASFARVAGVPVFMLDVVAQRALAQYIAERTDVAHKSPQVIMLRHGVATWHASHHRITAAALLRQLELAAAS